MVSSSERLMDVRWRKGKVTIANGKKLEWLYRIGMYARNSRDRAREESQGSI